MRISSFSFAIAIFIVIANISIAQSSELTPTCSFESLQSLSGSSFDNAYMLISYQQNADIAALAKFGSDYKSCLGLHELTRKIMHERSDLNAKLSLYYKQSTGCPISLTSEEIESASNLSSCEYTNALIAELEQSKKTADVAITRVNRSELRYQAKVISRTSGNEASALRRWQQTGNTAYATQWQPLSEYCGISRPTPCSDGCSMFSW